jgi:hypothetical protein
MHVSTAAKQDGLPEGPWTFPPVPESEKHALREIALHLLANAAVVSMTVPTGATGAETCGERMTKALGDSTYAVANAATLFGAAAGQAPAYYPPTVPVDAKSALRMADARVQIEMHVLRAAASLALKLRDDAVDAQTSIAWARTGGLAEDQRLAAAWGVDDPSTPSKNSLAHAAKTQFGRLDLGSGAPDRACNGVPGSKLMTSALGPLLDFVTHDFEAHTDGQRAAMAVVSGFGIVLPLATIKAAALRSVR